jgi:glycosyltransferase involved in cell wall biosynthesis
VSRPPLSIVLPTRDRPVELDATLAGVTRQLDAADRLVVVDSASRAPGAVAEVARRHGAEVLRLDQPGAARARNAGWQATTTELVVFVDDTLMVDGGWLDALVTPLVDDPRRGFVAGRIDAAGGRTGSKPIAVHRAASARPVEAGDPAPGDSASLAVRVDALRAVGGFDERLGPGTWYAAADDLNLLDRILLAGWTGWYEPAARASSPQPDGRAEIARKVWDYGKASGGRLALLARRCAGGRAWPTVQPRQTGRLVRRCSPRSGPRARSPGSPPVCSRCAVPLRHPPRRRRDSRHERGTQHRSAQHRDTPCQRRHRDAVARAVAAGVPRPAAAAAA